MGDAGEPAEVEGVAGEWRVEPALLDGAVFRPGGVALAVRPTGPGPQAAHRPVRLRVLPGDVQAGRKRRWGYFALPILYDDRLVGKLDAKADRKAGVLTVFAIHRDTPFDKRVEEAVDAEIDDLARWLDVELRFAAA